MFSNRVFFKEIIYNHIFMKINFVNNNLYEGNNTVNTVMILYVDN